MKSGKETQAPSWSEEGSKQEVLERALESGDLGIPGLETMLEK